MSAKLLVMGGGGKHVTCAYTSAAIACAWLAPFYNVTAPQFSMTPRSRRAVTRT